MSLRLQQAFLGLAWVGLLGVAPKPLSAEPESPAAAGAAAAGQKRGADLLFTRNDLYGHIDGGAELFLEFGFEDLTVQRFEVGGVQMELEDYRMSDPAAALGIYLAKCGAEAPHDDIPARNTVNRYQLTSVKGVHFIQVNNFSGEQTRLPDAIDLAQRRLAGIEPAADLEIWGFLPEEGLVVGSERLFRGPFALQPVYTFGEGDILQLHGKILGVLADYADVEGNVTTRLVVPYSSRGEALAAYHNLQANLDSSLEVVERTDAGFAWKDYRDLYGQAMLRDRVLTILIGLAQPLHLLLGSEE
jgi:hypothetical protein